MVVLVLAVVMVVLVMVLVLVLGLLGDTMGGRGRRTHSTQPYDMHIGIHAYTYIHVYTCV